MQRSPEDVAREATDAQLQAMRLSRNPQIAEAATREIARRADDEWARHSRESGAAA